MTKWRAINLSVVDLTKTLDRSERYDMQGEINEVITRYADCDYVAQITLIPRSEQQ